MLRRSSDLHSSWVLHERFINKVVVRRCFIVCYFLLSIHFIRLMRNDILMLYLVVTLFEELSPGWIVHTHPIISKKSVHHFIHCIIV
jgi:hypothetical protein